MEKASLGGATTVSARGIQAEFISLMSDAKLIAVETAIYDDILIAARTRPAR